MNEPNSKMDDQSKPQNDAKIAPVGFRIVISILFFCLSLCFLAFIIDTVVEDLLIFAGKTEVNAEIVNKEMTHGKSGYRYYISYVFRDGEKEYVRSDLFGLISENTELTRREYDNREIGSVIPVIYSRISPSYNRPRDILSTNDNMFWLFLGVIVFGGISLNEFRSLRRKKNES
jgi:hypothetical protein